MMFPRVGVGVLVVQDNRILLGERQGAHGAGTWAAPGGHLEFGETVHACAIREVKEETGLAIYNLRDGPFSNDFFVTENKHYVTLFVIAHCHTSNVQLLEPDKCKQWQWFLWSQLPEPLFEPLASLCKTGYTPF